MIICKYNINYFIVRYREHFFHDVYFNLFNYKKYNGRKE